MDSKIDLVFGVRTPKLTLFLESILSTKTLDKRFGRVRNEAMRVQFQMASKCACDQHLEALGQAIAETLYIEVCIDVIADVSQATLPAGCHLLVDVPLKDITFPSQAPASGSGPFGCPARKTSRK